MNKPLRASKQILHEEVQKLKKVGGYWIWPKEPENLENGYFRTSCTFGREKNDPNPITVSGEGKGKKAAEHAAASAILKIIESAISEDTDDNFGKPEPTYEVSKESGSSSRKTSATEKKAANYAAALTILKALLVYLPPSFKQQELLQYSLTQIAPPNSAKVKVLLSKLTRDLDSISFSDSTNYDHPRKPNSTTTLSKNLSICENPSTGSDTAKSPLFDQSEKNKLNKLKSIVDQPPSGTPTKVSDKVWYYSECQLGAGKISEVFRGFLEKASRIKAIKKVSVDDANLIEKHKSEEGSLKKLQKLNHEYFVQYYVTEEMDEHVYYVFEEADFTLEHFVKQSERPRSDEILTKICSDITKGLKNLHGRQIDHGDVNPQNVFIFLGERNSSIMPTAKLTAFGLSRVVNQIKHLPKGDFKLKRSRDIFQLGLTFGFTMTGGNSLVDISGHEDESIENLDVNWNLLDEPKFTALRNLLQNMLAENPAERGDTSIILEHPFFWDTDRSLRFILAVAADIKQNKVPSEQIQLEYEEYTYRFRISDNWNLRLDTPIQDWIVKEQKQKEEVQLTKPDKKKKPWQYRSMSAIQFIKFIRDQHQHYGNWKSIVKDSLRSRLEDENIWGQKGCNFGRYFVTKFPELTTILYNVMQKEEFQGNHTENFYGYNDCMCFDLTWDGKVMID